MIPLNILYTPLDTPPAPIVDTEKIIHWCKKYGPAQTVQRRRDSSLILDSEIYPWNIAYARNVGTWQGRFHKEFPEVAKFCYEVFKLPENDVNEIVLLPIKYQYAGIGFWHADADEHGLRIYLQNEDTEDSLLIRPTIIPYNSRPSVVVNEREPSPHIQNVEHTAKVIHPRQTFFLNNVRAVHTVKVNKPDSIRIAVIVAGLGPLMNMRKSLCELINRSAEKFSDAAIHWTPPE